ncbi:MAG: hypothetical protein EZS28_019230 [Streblomastix strix]|uniref:Cleavage stimulation factor subunit 2 hinge domain-containing protein n=1 Tax=Streblomastix strix TaxID=222440 RepID=A0A5J4VSE3_9EUKA|nr:MAG: hypothetical protein EZS28_019230 [Streblomastix strix]
MAIEKYNNMEYKRRKLRVSYPEKKGGEIRDMKGPINIQRPQLVQSLQHHVQIDEDVSQSLSSFSSEDLRKIVQECKEYILKDPEDARQMLIDYPQLAQALLQAMLMLGMNPNLPSHILASAAQRHAATVAANAQNNSAVVTQPAFPSAIPAELIEAIMLVKKWKNGPNAKTAPMPELNQNIFESLVSLPNEAVAQLSEEDQQIISQIIIMFLPGQGKQN